MKGYLFAQELDSIEPPKHFLDAGEPGHRLLAFTIGVGERQLDASLDGLALLHLDEKAGYVHVTALRMDCCSGKMPRREPGWYWLDGAVQRFLDGGNGGLISSVSSSVVQACSIAASRRSSNCCKVSPGRRCSIARQE